MDLTTPAMPAASSDILSNHSSIVPVRSLRDSRQSSLRTNIDSAHPPRSPRAHIAQTPAPMSQQGSPPPPSPLRVNIGSTLTTTFVPTDGADVEPPIYVSDTSWPLGHQ